MKVVGNLHILGQKSIIRVDSNPDSNFGFSGFVSDEFVDIDVLRGEALCYNHLTQRWRKADASSSAFMPCRAVALEDIAAGSSGKLLRNGTIRIDSYNLTKPFIYISSTQPGKLTTEPPVNPGDIIQKVGTPLKNNVMWLDFNTTTYLVK